MTDNRTDQTQARWWWTGHHHWIVRQTDVDSAIDTVGSNADQRYWYLHLHWIITWTDVDVSFIAAGWYTQPILMFSSSAPDRLPNRQWYATDCRSIELRRRGEDKRQHRRIEHWSDGDKQYHHRLQNQRWSPRLSPTTFTNDNHNRS